MENKSIKELREEREIMLQQIRSANTTDYHKLDLLIEIDREIKKRYDEVKEVKLKSIPTKTEINIYFLIMLIMIIVAGIYIYKLLN